VASRRKLLLSLLIPASALAAGAWWWARRVPGAGALHQFAPKQVQAGTPFEIKVLAGVWGQGAAPDARYRDWSLQLLQDQQPLGSPEGPASTGREGERLALRFQVTAPPAGGASPAVITWRVDFTFDGQPKQVAGPHAIAVAH
jgi:hypothetical protein